MRLSRRWGICLHLHIPAEVSPKAHMANIFLWWQPKAEYKSRTSKWCCSPGTLSLPSFSSLFNVSSLVRSKESALEEILRLILQILTFPGANRAYQPSFSNNQFSLYVPLKRLALAMGKKFLPWGLALSAQRWLCPGRLSRSLDKEQGCTGSGKHKSTGTYPERSLIFTAPRMQKQSSMMTWTAPNSKFVHLMFAVMVTSTEISISSERRPTKLKKADERLRD